jgi:hypothetical protein
MLGTAAMLIYIGPAFNGAFHPDKIVLCRCIAEFLFDISVRGRRHEDDPHQKEQDMIAHGPFHSCCITWVAQLIVYEIRPAVF